MIVGDWIVGIVILMLQGDIYYNYIVDGEWVMFGYLFVIIYWIVIDLVYCGCYFVNYIMLMMIFVVYV